MLDVIYSYDCNVIRATPRNGGTVRFIPLTLGGRKLSYLQLRKVADNEWPKQVGSFRMLGEGQGFE